MLGTTSAGKSTTICYLKKRGIFLKEISIPTMIKNEHGEMVEKIFPKIVLEAKRPLKNFKIS